MELKLRIKVLSETLRKKFEMKDWSVYLQRCFKIFKLLYSGIHKKIIASFLLAVYCFVSLPVSAWHSHKKLVTEKNTASFKSQTGSSLIIAADDNSEGNCKICEHQYQLQNNDAIAPFIPELILTGSEKTALECSPLKAPVYTFFNKGPPVFI
jgi:hypothetical protein